MHTAVTDRLTVTLAEAKAYLRVEHDAEDTLITGLVDAAKSAADAFLNNPFLKPDGTDASIPPDVKLWVLRRVAFSYEQRLEALAAENVVGVGTTEYLGKLAGASTADVTLLRQHRLNPGL